MFWRRSDEQRLSDILAACEDSPVVCHDGGLRRRHSGVLREAVVELRKAGLSPTEIIALIAFIIDVIQVVGPFVAEVVDKVLERWRSRK